jgi:hypothetical protein
MKKTATVYKFSSIDNQVVPATKSYHTGTEYYDQTEFPLTFDDIAELETELRDLGFVTPDLSIQDTRQAAITTTIEYKSTNGHHEVIVVIYQNPITQPTKTQLLIQALNDQAISPRSEYGTVTLYKDDTKLTTEDLDKLGITQSDIHAEYIMAMYAGPTQYNSSTGKWF